MSAAREVQNVQTRFVAGQRVRIRDQAWHVESAAADRGATRLDVSSAGGHRRFLLPFDRVAPDARRATPVRVRRAGARARLAQSAASTFSVRSLPTVLRAPISLYPHQLEPALAVQDGHRRILIADAVGLGKTLAAGLIVGELLRRQPTSRVLVIAPAGLIDQWSEELAHRLAVETRLATSAERPRAIDTLTFGHDPWLRPGVWIGSPDYLKQPHILGTMPRLAWDAVVVDEAHTAAGSSDRHAAVHALCQQARRVVLLTATPHSGNEDDFGRLVAMGDLGLPGDELVVFQRGRDALEMPVARRVRWHGVRLPPAITTLFDRLDAYARSVRVASAGTEGSTTAALLATVFWRRALSSLAAFSSTVSRRLEWLDARVDEPLPWLQPRLDFGEDDEISGDEQTALTAESGLARAVERRALRQMQAMALAAAGGDPKPVRLLALLQRTTEPVVVFTEFRRTLEVVADRLSAHRDVAILHGGMPIAERRTELTRFLRGTATVLLSTDVGGQGLNLQTRARWVVSLDVPWNPSRLEQRVGRVDRIGQRRPVHATVLLLRHEQDDGLRSALVRRATVARQATGRETFASFAGAQTSRGTDTTPGWAAGLLRPTTAWRRRGRAVARVLSRKRGLAARWQAKAPAIAGPIVFSGALGGHGRAGCGRSAALVGTHLDLVTDAGLPIERHLVVVAVEHNDEAPGGLPSIIAAASHAAASALGARMNRVRRLLIRRQARERAVDAAVRTHLASLTPTRAVQPGLFFGRQVPISPADITDVANGQAPAARADASLVTCTTPVPVWIWLP